LIAPGFHGAASPASAGLLAPSVERADGPAQVFADAARDAWSDIAEMTRARSAHPFDVKRDGIMRIARTDEEAVAIAATLRGKDRWLAPNEARTRVPALGSIVGAALLAGDGIVNVPAALAALWAAVRWKDEVTVLATSVSAIEPQTGGVSVHIGDGRRIDGDVAVLAAGAWTPTIRGVPRALPIRPLRGVMVSVEGDTVPLPIYDAAGHVYAFPRQGRTVIGATSDEVGFDASAPDDRAQELLSAATQILPVIAKRARHAPWAGLRPMTPDGLPVLGRDPDFASILYASGHGRNGFLEAAITGQVIAALVLGDAPLHDIAAFSPSRFDRRNQL
jgi:glycine oxidase